MNYQNPSEPASSPEPDEQRPDHYRQASEDSAGSPPPPPGPPPYGPGGGDPQPYGPYGPGTFNPEPYRTGPPEPPYGSLHDPRYDPRWVHSTHHPTDEIRSIPYFSGQYNDPGQYPKQPRRRRGPLSLILNGIGILAFGFLLIGFLALVFDWDSSDIAIDDFSLEEFFAPDDASEQADPIVPDPGAVDGSLVDQLDHVHQGITIDWENGGQHTGPGLDPGQEVSQAPGIFMVDTQVYQYLGFGSGMVLSSDGLAITNYHVVESSTSVSITMADTNERYSATVLGRDASRDIAVLQIDTDEFLEVASINPGEVSIGDTVAGVGNAGGQGYLTSVVGEIQGTSETIHIEPQEPGSPAQWLEDLIMITSDIVPGYSGGPTVDANGQVIGVSTAASQNTTNSEDAYGYAVPIVNALEVVEQVLAGDDSGDVVIGTGGALGIVVSSEPDTGARVMEVMNGSAGHHIGLQPDDVILEIDGNEVLNSSYISRYVRDKDPGEEVEVVWRTVDGEIRSATAVLEEASIN
ncbi:MAG TPA: S1C family serine protease [Enteractinococcus helveticum]|mgnify:CR=1 FL=1|uniref:S1C family serine protease n=1 Tax=Enteractinococcus helveticum TaxID=1837282 RepID=A0A921FLJ5_9MICC|nr:trypsin-like peptidase domain-containing protein [Enteractinococcus helveticum]HJF14353.1 S1C family serine protease [Enteractinococcus helveticum]